MNDILNRACVAGCERLTAWTDLLDRINVFPVADGDTGRNLLLSLSPLRTIQANQGNIIEKILLNARGNSGNIAAQFFSEFLKTTNINELPDNIVSGKNKAWKAVDNPKPGTMLTVFDYLADMCQQNLFHQPGWHTLIIDHLQKAVLETPKLMPKLQQAGVVDSGALGMFIFFEGFFFALANQTGYFQPVSERFKDYLAVAAGFEETLEEGFCVDIVMRLNHDNHDILPSLREFGESIVIIPEDPYTKIHLHTHDPQTIKSRLQNMGEIIKWSSDDIDEQIEVFKQSIGQQAAHIMTDAAGSLTRDDAHELGFTLLSSYINFPHDSITETYCPALDVYAAMTGGAKLSTSQASDFERTQRYQGILDLYPKVIYLCVGSVFTGNYDFANRWKKEHDPHDNLLVIDSQAASGKLAVLVLHVMRKLNQGKSAAEIIDIIKKSLPIAEEFLFLDKLEFLARGGRLSKTKAFFGDLLHKKPVVSPTAEGAVKVGITTNRDEQIEFALNKLNEKLPTNKPAIILLEYTDNKEWLTGQVLPLIEKRYPLADLKLQPLSLTTGVHTGPGTWGVAFLAENN